MGTKTTNIPQLDSIQYQLSLSPPTKIPLLALVFIPLAKFNHLSNSTEPPNNRVLAAPPAASDARCENALHLIFPGAREAGQPANKWC